MLTCSILTWNYVSTGYGSNQGILPLFKTFTSCYASTFVLYPETKQNAIFSIFFSLNRRCFFKVSLQKGKKIRFPEIWVIGWFWPDLCPLSEFFRPSDFRKVDKKTTRHATWFFRTSTLAYALHFTDTVRSVCISTFRLLESQKYEHWTRDTSPSPFIFKVKDVLLYEVYEVLCIPLIWPFSQH